MRRTTVACIFVLAVALVWSLPCAADQIELQTSDTVSITSHTVSTPTGTIRYRATAGMLPVDAAEDSTGAQIFYIAYERTDVSGAGRPITFAFNGGPGSASVWLHFGVMGPHRVQLLPDGRVPPPPPVIKDNPETWLAFTDIVFIDPVGTGYSRADEAGAEREYYEFKRDITSVSEAIRLYTTRAGRWLSPKFIAGESYGTIRAVGVAAELQQRHGMAVNGLVLISPVLDFSTIRFDTANNLPYALFLPTYAATAHYHGRIPDSSEIGDVLAEVESWARDEYSVLLMRGSGLSDEEINRAAARMAAFTGLSAEYIARSRLRVLPWRFRRELLRDEDMITGRMDSRLTGPDIDGGAAAGRYDPSLDMLSGVFAGAANHYVREHLGFSSDRVYEFLNRRVAAAWNWQEALKGGQGYVQVLSSLAAVMNSHPRMPVFMAAGLFDLATPYFAAQYSIDQLPVSRQQAADIELLCYPAGHMMYTSNEVLSRMQADAQSFYSRAIAR